MEFKETLNRQTGKVTYFVDGKQVSKSMYDIKQEVCIMNNYKYNSSSVSGNGRFTHYYYNMN